MKPLVRAFAALALSGAVLSPAGPARADALSGLDDQESSVSGRSVVSFLPGVVDETWIVSFEGK
ncbi:hypothetical protein [Streptomyces sp. NPDC058872]|uniref:hypothetical protein n=1 Tax=Streptomyces sp. NPDC058872 TaxID=3346661 RepID=UPI0036D16745